MKISADFQGEAVTLATICGCCGNPSTVSTPPVEDSFLRSLLRQLFNLLKKKFLGEDSVEVPGNYICPPCWEERSTLFSMSETPKTPSVEAAGGGADGGIL